MKTFYSKLSTCFADKFLRIDEKYHSAVNSGDFNLSATDNNVFLSDILEEDYTLFDYSDGDEHKGIPTGQAYIDEDGDIINWQIVSEDSHPGRLKYSITNDNLLLSSLRLAKSPALNFDFEDINNYVFSNGFYIFKVKHGWDKRFVLYLLRSKKLKQLIDEKIYRGIGISSFKICDLFKVNIRNISLKEQISAFKLIEPIENEIRILKQAKSSIQVIIDSVLKHEFGFNYEKFEGLKKGSRFIGAITSFSSNNPDLRFSVKFHRPAGEFVQQELRRITKKKIKHFLAEPILLGASIKPDDFDESGEAYYVSMASIKNQVVEYDDSQLVSTCYRAKNAEKTLQKGDLIMARSGVAIGKIALVEEDVNSIFADFTMRIKLTNYNVKFAYYYMRSTYFQYLIEIYKKGLQNQNIFPIVIKEFPIPDISLEEQQRIVDEIQEEIDKQTAIKQQISSLRGEIDKIIEKAISIGCA